MVWDLFDKSETDDERECGKPRKIMKGHSHFISDLDLSQDSRFCLSSSWDGSIRLWNLKTATTRKTLIGHSKDVLSVAFSPDNRQIASGSIDKSVKIWNVHGVCKFTVDQNPHTDWVSCVRYFHDVKQPIVVSASWDKTIKVWDNSVMALKHTFVGHKAQINTLDLAPNTNFIASGGRDGKVNVWNLVVGTEKGIKVYDLPHKKFIDFYEAPPHASQMVGDASKKNHSKPPAPIGCTSLVWSKNQQHLYAGFTDGQIRVLAIVNSN